MRRGNLTGRLLRIEAEAEERGRSAPATMSDEERCYRIMLLTASVKKRAEAGVVNPNPPDPEESRRRYEAYQRMQPRLLVAEEKIQAEAKCAGLTVEEYLRRRFPWVSYSKRSSQWR